MIGGWLYELPCAEQSRAELPRECGQDARMCMWVDRSVAMAMA